MIGDRDVDATLARSDPRAGGVLVLPAPVVSVFREVARRVVFAVVVVLAVAVLVWVQRDGYTDVDDEVSFLDAVYYATVGVSTTGYGDITAVSESARLVNTVVVTPLRVLFLIVLVGTTVELLTQRTREQLRLQRWRKDLGGHTVLVGYGTKGTAAVRALDREGVDLRTLVTVDTDPEHGMGAVEDGFVAVNGDGTREDVLLAAGVDIADRVIVAVSSDETAVLATITARRLNPRAVIVAAAHSQANAELLRDSGADTVVVSSEAAGRLLGVAVSQPSTGQVVSALLAPDGRLTLRQRVVRDDEVGQRARDLDARAVAVVRAGRTIPLVEDRSEHLRPGDRLVVLQETPA